MKENAMLHVGRNGLTSNKDEQKGNISLEKDNK